MKRILLSAVLGFAFILGGSYTANAKNSSNVSKTFKVQKGGTLSVSINSGDITIKSWDKLEVSVNIDGVDNDDNRVQINKTNNTISIIDNESWGWGSSKDVVVSLPSEFNIDVNTRQGDVDFRGNLTGYFKAVTGGGDIQLGNIKGNTEITTNGGDIESGDISGDVTFSSKGGDIKVGNVSGKTKINTMGGSIDVGNIQSDAEINTFGGEISIGNVRGNANLKTLGGNINADKISGSASLSTNGGNIQLDGASGDVRARTLGGNISLKNIKGSANVTTNAGDVEIEFLTVGNDESKISTLNGGITVYISPSAKATIEASVRSYGYWDQKDGKKFIQSEFPAKSFDTSSHSRVKAVYQLNGGGTVINLKATNDKIRIKKLNQ